MKITADLDFYKSPTLVSSVFPRGRPEQPWVSSLRGLGVNVAGKAERWGVEDTLAAENGMQLATEQVAYAIDPRLLLGAMAAVFEKGGNGAVAACQIRPENRELLLVSARVSGGKVSKPIKATIPLDNTHSLSRYAKFAAAGMALHQIDTKKLDVAELGENIRVLAEAADGRREDRIKLAIAEKDRITATQGVSLSDISAN